MSDMGGSYCNDHMRGTFREDKKCWVCLRDDQLADLQGRHDALQAKVSEARLLALAAATRSYADDMRSDLGEIVAVLSTNDRINLTADLEGHDESS